MSRVIILGLSITLSLAVETASAQERINRVTLDEAVKLATRENPTLRAKEFERQSVAANEITAGLRPNPQTSFLAEQFGGGSASQTQYNRRHHRLPPRGAVPGDRF
jgi:hypothetical protein